MKTTIQKIKLIEKNTVERDYGLRGTEAIINHPKLGRLYIADGFGGMDTIKGGAVRWRHGIAIKILSTDTLESLRKADDRGNDDIDYAMHSINDNSGREVLCYIDGHVLQTWADTLCL